MKVKLTTFFISLLLFTNPALSQYLKKDEDIIRFLSAFNNRSYVQGGEQEKFFFHANGSIIEKLNDEISELPIDRCKYEKIEIVMFIDSSGAKSDMLLKTGTGISRIDSIIVNKTQNFTKWTPAVKDGVNVNFLASFTFVLFNSHHVTRTTRTEKASSGLNDESYEIRIQQTKQFDHDKNCRDSEYFYQMGLEEFNLGKYKRASSYFSKAVIINPYFIDALFNLGLSYLKQNETTKACSYFEMAYKCGDEGSADVLNKLCKKEN